MRIPCLIATLLLGACGAARASGAAGPSAPAPSSGTGASAGAASAEPAEALPAEVAAALEPLLTERHGVSHQRVEARWLETAPGQGEGWVLYALSDFELCLRELGGDSAQAREECRVQLQGYDEVDDDRLACLQVRAAHLRRH